MDKQKLDLLAVLLTNKIKANTQAGIDKDGNQFRPYSALPFAMPYGAVANKTKLNQAVKAGKAAIVTKNDKKRVIWKQGYVDYRGWMGRDTSPVNLTFTGRMLSNLKPLGTEFKEFSFDLSELGDANLTGIMNLEIPKEIIATVGFENDTAKQVAIWNIVKGRKFLGLTDKDIETIVKDWLQE